MKLTFILLIALLAIHLLLLINLQFTAWPEMLSYPYLYSNGFSLYKDFAHPYTPLLTLFLTGVYSVFGLTVSSLQVFTWVWILITDILIFIISRLLFGNRLVTFLPLLLYVFLQPILEGNMLWLDLGITPPLLAGVFFALRWLKKEQKLELFFWGLFWSLSVFIKQQAGLLFVFAALYIFFFRRLRVIPNLALFIGGALIPTTVILSWLILNQNLEDFFFWTLIFPIYWLPKIPGYSDLPTIKELVVPSLIFLPGLLLVFLNKKKETSFLTIICIICITMAFPRFSYFHLQPALAVYVLLMTLNISTLEKKYSYLRMLVILPILGGFLLARHTFPLTWSKDPRFYGVADLNMARKLQDLIKPQDGVYLLGPYSSLYVFTNRLPPKPWFDSFVWYFEIPGIQEKQIEGLEKEKTKYILRQLPKPGEWYKLSTYQPSKIMEYLKLNYSLEDEFSEGVEQWKRKF